MDITREFLLNRIEELRAQHERLKADINAHLGALEFANQLLARLDAPTPPVDTPSA